ncbi:MAG: AzlC family ABC transporter permease [Alphaproteobacteria bacterium]|nr:AzlC family ABC transporter permease [Alphaproteobacteria bacterium]
MAGQANPFSWRGLGAGFRGASAPAAGGFVFGIAFGLLADQVGLALSTAVLMSMLVYSGTAQFVSLQAWGDPIPLAAICGAILATNARYVLLGASVRPWFHGVGRLKTYASLFLLSEGNWAPALRERLEGRPDAAYMLGCGLAMYASWVSATALGHALGQLIPDPRAFGIDFVLLAFFTVVAAGVWRGRRDIAPLVAAVAVALAVGRLAPGHWYILAGGLAGSLVAALKVDRDA